MISITDAILSIDPNAKVSIIGDEIDTAILSWKSTEISKSDIKNKMSELETKEANAKTKLETDKSNANQKLKDLGLTDDEIKAIKGIE